MDAPHLDGKDKIELEEKIEERAFWSFLLTGNISRQLWFLSKRAKFKEIVKFKPSLKILKKSVIVWEYTRSRGCFRIFPKNILRFRAKVWSFFAFFSLTERTQDFRSPALLSSGSLALHKCGSLAGYQKQSKKNTNFFGKKKLWMGLSHHFAPCFRTHWAQLNSCQ